LHVGQLTARRRELARAGASWGCAASCGWGERGSKEGFSRGRAILAEKVPGGRHEALVRVCVCVCMCA
jgi:hypothetical protein